MTEITIHYGNGDIVRFPIPDGKWMIRRCVLQGDFVNPIDLSGAVRIEFREGG